MRLDFNSGGVRLLVRHAVMNVAIILAVFIGQIFYLVYLLNRCQLTVYGSIPSPDGRFSAVIHEVHCGMMSRFNTRVSIAPANRPFSDETNPSFLWLRGRHDLTIRWLGEKEIEIGGVPKDATAFRSEPRVGDITVEYR